KGGLPVCACNGLLAKENGRSPTSNGKMINDDVAAMPKQFIGQVAMVEQQPSMAFSEDEGFLWGQQSMSSMEEDISCMEDDMSAVPAGFAAASVLAAVGRTATDRVSKRIRMVRPRCMVSVTCSCKIADFRPVRSSDDLALVLSSLRHVGGLS